ncbi:DUF4240 domain-containing protein [Kitasatospora sp. NPDC008115]|uniref:DUF4240 domain-containing protein n=1 Tax=Kitasatospora sp. NPDC008115 TaxID=3364022 RepID=UPI0036E8A503
MDEIDSFWKLIEECRRQVEGPEERLTWLRGELCRRSPAEAVQFQERLDEVRREAFTWDLWAAADRIFGGWCSDDGFSYFRLWMVGLGREAFSAAVAAPDALAGTPEVQRLVGRPRNAWGDDWPGWESLDHVAMEVYGLLTDSADDCGEAYYQALNAVAGDTPGSTGPLGEQWDVRCETDSAHRLPALSAMFPLRPPL